MQIFSIDIVGELALFKKNDANDLVHVSYNFIHKPVLLGIFGAIIGFQGYSFALQGEHPDFYKKLSNLKIAIYPLYNKPLKKFITGFNNASGMGSDAGTWQIKEQVMMGEPEIRYRVYIYNDGSIEQEDFNNLLSKVSTYKTEYPLYFGKNEFFAWYENYQEYSATPIKNDVSVIDSLVRLGENNDIAMIKGSSFEDFNPLALESNEGYTVYEYLPYDFDKNGFYIKDIFILTQRKLILKKQDAFYTLTGKNGEKYNVQFI